MRLSPWEPPRLLWAAVEGLFGVNIGSRTCTVAPIHPPGWKWMALRRLPSADGYMTFFTAFEERGATIYSNTEFDTPYILKLVCKDVTNKVHPSDYRVHRAAFLQDGVVTICLGNESDAYVSAVVTITEIIDPAATYSVSIYSNAGGHVELGESTGEGLTEMAVSIEEGEFRILVFAPV